MRRGMNCFPEIMDEIFVGRDMSSPDIGEANWWKPKTLGIGRSGKGSVLASANLHQQT